MKVMKDTMYEGKIDCIHSKYLTNVVHEYVSFEEDIGKEY